MGCQPTVRPVVAIESVFQINVGLSDEVIRTHKVMIEHSYSQLRPSRERNAEFQDPGQERAQLRNTPTPWGWSCGGRGGLSTPVHSPTITTSCLSESHRARWQSYSPSPSPGPCLTLQRWDSAAWGCIVPWCPAAPGQRSPPYRGLLCHWGLQEPGW